MSNAAPPPQAPSPEDTQRIVGPTHRRRLSPGALLAFLLAAAAVGVVAGLAFNRWWTRRYDASRTPTAAPLAAPARGVGTASSPVPDMVFNTTKIRLPATPEVLESGATEVYCFFTIPGESPSAEVAAWWLEAGQEPVRAEGQVVKEHANDLRGYVVLKPPKGAKSFGNGVYEVALYIADEKVVEGSFALLKGAAELLKRPPGMERYRPEVKDVVVSAGVPSRKSEKPLVLPAGAQKVTASFSYAHALSGTAFTVQWLYEDGLIQQATTEVVIKADAGQGQAWFATKPPSPLPTGRYAVLISLGEDTPPLARESFWVGRAPRPEELQPAR